jgi:hypothetical protein
MQKTDGALAQSRRGFHVELGAREKAVSISYIYICYRVGIRDRFGQIRLFRKGENLFWKDLCMSNSNCR